MGTFPVELLSALSDDLLHETGWSYDQLERLSLPPHDCNHRLASAWSIARSIRKKFLPVDSSRQDLACLTKFLAVNERSGAWKLCLNTSLDEELWGTFKNVLYRFFNPSGMPLVGSLDDLFLNGTCGPGSSIGALNGDFYSKLFSSKLTCTSQCLIEHYQANTYRFPDWFCGEALRSIVHSGPDVVQGSRLSFVPKNDTTSRSICTEPILNMYYQLGLGAILTRRLKSFFKIDLSTQPVKNAELALRGSLDNSWSTIDLESASDTLSMALYREVLPYDVFSYVSLLRSPRVSYNGSTQVLHMCSTMGNGFTFPLQTIAFAAMVSAVNTSLSLFDSVNVFGDDILIRQVAVLRLRRLLSLCGCVVNDSKSFSEGPFRESCGYDYFLGRNIRGPYIKSLNTLQDSYAAINMLNRFSARSGLCLRRSVKYLLARVDRSFVIPFWENPSGGIQVPEYFVANRRASKTTFGTLYKIYEFQSRRVPISDEKPMVLPNGKTVSYNPGGLMIALLSGMALSSGLPLRQAGRWKRKRRSCSYWDSFDPGSTFLSGFSWQQWNSAVYENLTV